MAKADLPNSLVDEMIEMQYLFSLGSGRTTIPAGTWTSTSSSVVYSHTGGNDLFAQLNVILNSYLITASDWNASTTDIAALQGTISLITRSSFQVASAGWTF